MLPAASVARDRTWYVPFGYFEESNVVRQRPSPPRTPSPSLVEPAQKLTAVTPTLSLADATSAPTPETVEPDAGLTIEVVGAVLSAPLGGDGVGVRVGVGLGVRVGVGAVVGVRVGVGVGLGVRVGDGEAVGDGVGAGPAPEAATVAR